jgi:transcriptional regulator GlxA family with amidase domain
MVGRVLPLDELWGEGAARRLRERLADAGSAVDALAILEGAIAERLGSGGGDPGRAQIVLAAAAKLTSVNVGAVAVDLGMSERHLRRLFREAVGVSPKVFSKLARFRRALSAARADTHASWANIAASAGYYDQAHLIGEFQAIAGVTPAAFLGELRAAPALG